MTTGNAHTRSRWFGEGGGIMPTVSFKWFSAEKGYGFIAPTDGSIEDAFVHISDVQASASSHCAWVTTFALTTAQTVAPASSRR